jgi:hypothetical protein
MNVHPSACTIGTPLGVLKNAAMAGASAIVAAHQNTPATALTTNVTCAASSRRSGQ